jgi:pilus assembly protein CpaF
MKDQFLGPAGPILDWLSDPEVTDVLINGSQSAYVERCGALVSVVPPFSNRTDFSAFIERILVPLGKRLDATKPYVDGRLMDGTRFHLVLPPIAVAGPVLSIRKGRASVQAPLSSFGPQDLIEEVRAQFRRGVSILVSGGTGSGKTTFLSRLLETVPESERVLVIEETSEIQVAHPHCVYLEARSANPDGLGEVTLKTLVRNALRMRPDRIVLGECRGDEAWDLLQALNSGHGGSACTLHANSPQDALKRLESLVLMAGIEVPVRVVREWVASSVGLVVQLERERQNRGIQSVIKIHGLEGERYRIAPFYLKGT